MATKNELTASSGRMNLLVRRLACALAGHSTYATKTDGKSNLRRSPVDDFVETECHRCGRTLRAAYGLALPNLKLGSPKTLPLGVERMSEAQRSSPSAPGGNPPPNDKDLARRERDSE